MSTRTNCDNCNTELVNYQARVSVLVVHRTSNGDFLGEDEFKSTDLCHDCIVLMEKIIPITTRVRMPNRVRMTNNEYRAAINRTEGHDPLVPEPGPGR